MQLYTWITVRTLLSRVDVLLEHTSVGTLVRIGGMITQVIFGHSLRIRMKPSEDVSHIGEASSTTTAKSSGSSVKCKATAADDEKGDNLVGKINSLVAVNQDNISMVAFWLYFSSSDVAVMIACLPLPGWVAKRIQSIQETAMKNTDARMQTATGMLGVFRMIKLFGWEQKIEDWIWLALIRLDEELNLKWNKSRELATLATHILDHVIPLFQMVATMWCTHWS
ncbi:unnamed protein product [Peniophora sp. CBMAI 1063]|nr:unnamed protein product [Peniophora sp. CBMAI 1063]